MSSVSAQGQLIGEPVAGWTRRASPEPVTMTGRYCSVTPLRVSDAADLFEALHRDGSGIQWTYLPYGPFADAGDLTSFLTVVTADASLVPFALRGFHRPGRGDGKL